MSSVDLSRTRKGLAKLVLPGEAGQPEAGSMYGVKRRVFRARSCLAERQTPRWRVERNVLCSGREEASEGRWLPSRCGRPFSVYSVVVWLPCKAVCQAKLYVMQGCMSCKAHCHLRSFIIQDFCFISKIEHQQEKCSGIKDMYITGIKVLSLWYLTTCLCHAPCQRL